MAGFYRSTYADIDGNPKIMASTQFEALDARRAFPCWDEPARKAVFQLTLTVKAGLECLSNMPESSRVSLSRTLSQVTFMDSPSMSTYLLAFCVGEFDHIQDQTEHGVLIKVYTPPGKAESGRFALDCAVRSLDKYDDFFQLPYPLPKLDMVAIPEVSLPIVIMSSKHSFKSNKRLLHTLICLVTSVCGRCHGKLGTRHLSRS